jgi:polar amino acid transport system substrate-binding protein
VIVSRFKILKRLFFLALLIVGLGTGRAGHAETLKVCYDQWPPLTIFPSNGSSARGVVIDMLEQIYTAQGYELEFFEVPLARGLAMVSDGLCDILPEYVGSVNTENDFVYGNEPTFAYTTAFVVRRGDPWRYRGIQSVIGKRVGTGPGWDYSSMSMAYQYYIDDPKNADFVEVVAGYDDVIDRILRMIVEDRVDLYADNELVLQHVLNRLDLHDELQVTHPGLEKKLVERPIFSKRIPDAKRQQLIRVWDEGRLLIKGEQEKMILKKYNVSLDDPR